MIAQRFRAFGWVAGIATAACGLYLISSQVAAERAKLEGVEARIAAARRDMRQLQTELGTRASMRQLEKWNGETLALTAPRAAQYLKAEYQLASLDRHALPSGAAPVVAAVAVVSVPPRLPEHLERAAYSPTGDALGARAPARRVIATGTLRDLALVAAAERSDTK